MEFQVNTTASDNIPLDMVIPTECYIDYTSECYYIEIDDSTSDFRISDDLDNEICLLNLNALVNDGVVSDCSIESIREALTEMSYMDPEDVLLVRTEDNVIESCS